MKRFLALLLTLVMLLSLMPTAIAAAPAEKERDIWDVISEIEANAARRNKANTAETLEATYNNAVDEIIDAVTSSSSYVPGTLERHGNFFFWVDKNGDPNGYSPSYRAKREAGRIPGANAEDFAATEVVNYNPKGGSAASMDVAAFQPYIGIDGSFTAQYENRCNAVAQATGGTGTTYKTNDANVNNLGLALSTCGVVIFDSHGTTDYDNGSWSNPDYTSRANDSYLCLPTGTGLTPEDKSSAQGEFGTYYHAFSLGGGDWAVDGTAIANHMNGTAPNSIIWMAICLGMATEGMEAPFRANGAEVVYGYSQSVTFTGDYKYEGFFWPYFCQDHTVAEACAYMKEKSNCDWDPAYSSYSYSQAVANHVAFPIVASSEDPYPGHGNVDVIQVPTSTYTLFTQFNISAVSNNNAWGTVAVSGRQITATPNTGYEVAGYEVLEGTCTVTQNGNVFQVNAETDCTVQINFAARVPATVVFNVPEGVSCDNFNGYVGDTITLPTPTGTPTANAHNYAFRGWTTAPIEDDVTEVPTFVKAGTELTVTDPSVTYYALYSYFIADEGFGEGEFNLVTSARNNWSGEYVITYQGEKVLDASGDVTGSTISSAVAEMSEIGGVLTGESLSNIDDDYIFVVEEVSSGVYSIKMKEPDVWLALTSNSNSLNTATSDSADAARWTFSYGSDGVKITSVKYTERSLRYNNQANVFRCYKQGQQPISLYASAPGTKYYTTVPKDGSGCDHVFGDWTTVTEPTCTTAGQEKRVCTLCGYTQTHTLDALGHDYNAVVTEPTCTEGGFTTYTCARCGDTYTGDETEALGHAWDEGVVTVEPCHQFPGEKLMTCTRCGETETVEIPRLSNPFEDVHDEDFFFNPVMWALDETVTGGVDDTHFAPERTVMRADSMVFFWAANGRPEFTATDKTFKDVKKKHWAYKAVMWAVENGITGGTDKEGNYFSPQRTCMRSEVLQFLYAAMGKPEISIVNPYSDVKPKHWYYEGAIWAYEKGLEKGEDGKFQAKTPCTRGYVVTYLYRYFTGNELDE